MARLYYIALLHRPLIKTGGSMSDLIYLASGVAIFIVFAGYAYLLRRT